MSPVDDWPYDPQADPALSRHVAPDGSIKTADEPEPENADIGPGFEALRARRAEHEALRDKKPARAKRKPAAKRKATPPAPKAEPVEKPAAKPAKPKAAKRKPAAKRKAAAKKKPAKRAAKPKAAKAKGARRAAK